MNIPPRESEAIEVSFIYKYMSNIYWRKDHATTTTTTTTTIHQQAHVEFLMSTHNIR